MRKMEDFSEVNLSPEIIREIQKIGKKYGISQIVLFGSRARKTNWEKSDIDLMISTPDSAVQLDFNNTFGYENFAEIKSLMPWIVRFTFSGDTMQEMEMVNLFAI